MSKPGSQRLQLSASSLIPKKVPKLALGSVVPPFFAFLIWVAAVVFGIRALATGRIKG
jgi:hypothetical protein